MMEVIRIMVKILMAEHLHLIGLMCNWSITVLPEIYKLKYHLAFYFCLRIDKGDFA